MTKLSSGLKTLGLLASAAMMTVAATTAYAASDVKANLRILTFGGEAQLEATHEAIKRFNEDYPNVTVEVAIDPITNGWGEFVTKVYSQYNAGNSYDVYHTATETLHSLAGRNLMLSLDDRYQSLDDLADFDPQLFELSKYKDKVYFIPSTWNNIMVNYNRTMFDEAGIEYPKADWSWDDFVTAAKAITKRDEKGNIIQFGYEISPLFFMNMPWFFTNDTSVVNDDWTESNMMDPKVTETLQFLYDLIHVHKVSPVPTNASMDNQFFAGQVGMVSRGHWIITNAMKNNLNMDVAPPAINREAATVIGFGAYGISKETKYPDLSWALIQEMVSKESQVHETKLGGAIPGRQSISKIEEFTAFPPSSELYYATLPTAKAVPSPVNFQEVSQIFNRHFLAMMAGEVSIEEGVQRAHTELTRSFKRAKRITERSN